MTIINVLAGEDFATEATALEGFSQTSLWATPGSVEPTLARVNPRTSVVTTGSNTFVTDWSVTANNVDAVSAVLMHDHVYNEFNLETGTKSGTDWVLTMPTKRFYIATGPGNNAGALFQRNFNGNGGSCDDVTVTCSTTAKSARCRRRAHSRRRRRRRPTRSAGKRTSSRTTTRTCSRRRTAPTFRRRSARAGRLSFPLIGTAGSPSAKHVLYGGASVVFNTSAGVTSPASTTFNGLPVIGFAAITFNNSEIPGTTGGLVQSSYGGSYLHKATRSISAN